MSVRVIKIDTSKVYREIAYLTKKKQKPPTRKALIRSIMSKRITTEEDITWAVGVLLVHGAIREEKGRLITLTKEERLARLRWFFGKAVKVNEG